ncbi:hypothetical protein [Aquimarina algicola]|uniref:Uncharacterized protein n=1 Tax=Aquimarina algicola TaxID=2589995 RepID=A0A504J2Q7_9FLAO|nr:hypothetical protein [Aquimarina algicola]TPN81369.1 hypothetical protein FHK87_25625 [Aquimarina algicola]
MITLNSEKIIKRSLYLIALPVLIILILGIEYLISAKEAINGNYEYSFMLGADAIPIPWYMKTEEFFIKYCIGYGSSLILLTVGYVFALLKNNKFIQLAIGVITILILYYEYRMFLNAIP